jgi:hypothetical protein
MSISLHSKMFSEHRIKSFRKRKITNRIYWMDRLNKMLKLCTISSLSNSMNQRKKSQKRKKFS